MYKKRFVTCRYVGKVTLRTGRNPPISAHSTYGYVMNAASPVTAYATPRSVPKCSPGNLE